MKFASHAATPRSRRSHPSAHRSLLALCAAIAICSSYAVADVVEMQEEHFPSGQLKRRFTQDKLGYQGTYDAWYSSGTARIKGNYRNDLRHGLWNEWDEEGLPVRRGAYVESVFTGITWRRPDPFTEYEETWMDDILVQPDTREGILRGLATAHDPYGHRNHASEARRALNRLQGYRLLAGVPWRLRWNDEFATKAIAAARLCDANDKIESKPSNPGWAEDEFLVALDGVQRCAVDLPKHADGPNIATFPASKGKGLPHWFSIDRLVACTSDSSLFSRLRCLDPRLRQTAFAKVGDYVALWGHAAPLTTEPNWDVVYWPPRGLIPRSHLTTRAPWSLFLNRTRYRPVNAKKLRITMTAYKRAPKSTRHLDHGETVNVDGLRTWMPTSHPHMQVVAFKPRVIDTRAGGAAFVVVQGLEDTEGKPVSLKYFVVFD